MNNVDFSKLIGVKYEKLNCWALCREFYKLVFDIELKHYFDTLPEAKNELKSLISANERDFHKVRSPKFGDLLTIKLMGVESHVGVFVGNGLFLHTTKNTGSCIDRIAKWNRMIVGYYSLDKEAHD